MRMLMLAGGASLLGGGAYLGGAFEQSEYYEMAPVDVEARLAGLQLGPESGAEMQLVLRSRGPALLRWDLMAGRDRLAEVRANLSPADTGTRVSVNFAFAKGDALLGMEEDPFLNDVAEIAMVEKIDSTLDGRAFNVDVVQAKMAAMFAANPQAIVNMQQSIHDNVSKEMDRLAPPRIPREYGEPSSYGKPTMSAKPQKPTDFSKTHADGGWGDN